MQQHEQWSYPSYSRATTLVGTPGIDTFDYQSRLQYRSASSTISDWDTNIDMAENATPKAAGVVNGGDSAAGVPFYEKQRQHLKELIAKKKALDARIVSETIHPSLTHPLYFEGIILTTGLTRTQ